MQSSESADWVDVGIVARPHGIRGELHVKLHNPASDVLLAVEEVTVRVGEAPERLLRIRSARPAAEGVVLLAFEGIMDRTQAEVFRGAVLRVPRQILPEPEEGAFYVHDILGARVVGRDGTEYGTVIDYVTYPTADVLVVQGAKRYEIPVIEDFVHPIDPSSGMILVEGIHDFETT